MPPLQVGTNFIRKGFDTRGPPAYFASSDFHGGMYYQRNRLLVDASSVCIAYKTREKSGTGYTVSYAQEQGLRIINLADHIRNTTIERK